MAYSEKLAQRVREALVTVPNIEEKKMFRGITFMVNEKMCVSVSGDELMCRIDPALQEEVTAKNGCREMIVKGRPMKGFVYVEESVLKNRRELDYWIKLALDFNSKAKISKKKRKG